MASTHPPRAETEAGLETRRLRGALASKLFDVVPEMPRIGRYEVRGLLGQGAMGTVYRAHDPVLDRMVAIKVIARVVGPAGAAMERAVTRFRNEAQTLAQLRHPNVLDVLDVGRTGDQDFIAMALVEGGTLLDWDRRNPIGTAGRTRRVLALFRDAARGLSAAHHAGVIHRDIKPHNMLIDSTGTLLLADFGLAQMGHSDAITNDSGIDDDPTPPLAPCSGTPAYMAPEQDWGRSDPRSDQFSLCVAFWEVAGGVQPFEGSTLARLRLAVHDVAPLPVLPESKLPRWFQAILQRGMSKDPSSRFESLDALIHELDRSRSRWGRFAGAAAATVVLFAGGMAVLAPPAPQCSVGAAQAELVTVWNDARRVTLREGLRDSGLPGAGPLAATVEANLVAHAQAWSAQRVATCRAEQGARDLNGAVLSARTVCLRQNLATMDGLVTRLESADSQLAARSVETTRALPNPAACEIKLQPEAGHTPLSTG
ncbi:MAG: serine/threonine protein kinase, partial [Nannocystaceae bacterium]|nr:serine/threonine protein kinase [Nannocystaceae bacterium]